jgi:LysE type translocator
MTSLLGLLAVSVGMTLVPGIDTAMVLRVTLRSGRGAGLKTAAGCATGLFVHAGAVAVGLAALVVASATAYHVLKLAGALFLIGVGVATLFGTMRPQRAPRLVLARRPFVAGLLTNLGNPKALLFFLRPSHPGADHGFGAGRARPTCRDRALNRDFEGRPGRPPPIIPGRAGSVREQLVSAEARSGRPPA